METIKMSELKTVIQNIAESIITEKSKKEKKFDKVMHEFGKGTLKTPQGKTVTDQKQAVAIAYSESGLDEKKEEKITESNNKTMNKISLKESDFKEMIQNIVKKVLNESKEPKESKIIKIKTNELYDVIKNILKEECGKPIQEEKPINENLGEGYTHFAIDKNTGKIVNGWDYNGTDNASIKEYCIQDLKDQFPERKANEFKVVSKPYLIRQGINPSDDANWYDETGSMEKES